MRLPESQTCILEEKVETLICLSVFIVASGIWAFLSNKKQAQDRRGGGYYRDYDQGYDHDYHHGYDDGSE